MLPYTIKKLSLLSIVMLLFSCIIPLICANAQDNIQLIYNFQTPSVVPDASYKGKVFDKIISEEITSYGDGPYGAPNIPFKGLKILLPQGRKLSGITINTSEALVIPRDAGRNILPVNYSTTIDPAFSYNPDEYFPKQLWGNSLYQILGVYKCRGYQILLLNIYPIQYKKSTDELIYYPSLVININTVPSEEISDIMFRNLSKDKAWVQSFVENPDTADSYIVKQNLPPSSISLITEREPCDYLIIAASLDIQNAANNFADWKRSKGTSTNIVTIDEINYTSPPELALPEKIRNFIREAYLYWGTEYVLLAGDWQIPNHYFWAHCTSNFFDTYEDKDTVALSDIYYSNLDGNWNADGDERWGEFRDDNIDLFAEVFLGRAPVRDGGEMLNFAQKVRSYAEEPFSHEASNKIFLLGEYVWGMRPDGGYSEYPKGLAQWGGDYLDNGLKYIPGSQELIKFYERDRYVPSGYQTPMFSVPEITSRINQGVNLIAWNGHGNSTKSLNLTPQEIQALSNNHFFLLYNNACNGSDFAKYWLNYPVGAFAFIGYTSSSISEVDPFSGGCQDIYKNFMKSVFADKIDTLGKAFQLARESLNNYIPESGASLSSYYAIGFFGDPQSSLRFETTDKYSNAGFIYPNSWMSVAGNLKIFGSASAAEFYGYTISIYPYGERENSRLVYSSAYPVKNGLLGNVNLKTYCIPGNNYTLELAVNSDNVPFLPMSPVNLNFIYYLEGKPKATLIINPDAPYHKGGLITFSADGNVPEGVRIIEYEWKVDDSIKSNLASFSDNSLPVGPHTVSLRVKDSEDLWSDPVTKGIEIINSPPVINPIGNKVINGGQLLEFAVSASDPDGDALIYSAEGLPPGATFTTPDQSGYGCTFQTGYGCKENVFRWRPTYAQAGIYHVTFKVSDGQLEDTKTITITVKNVNR